MIHLHSSKEKGKTTCNQPLQDGDRKVRQWAKVTCPECLEVKKENEHRARIIRAAPELLSVARLALMCTEINLQDPIQLILLNAQMGNLAALAKFAIAKAEGKETAEVEGAR